MLIDNSKYAKPLREKYDFIFKDILLARYVAYPSLVVSITMTTLHMDWSGRRQRDSKESETLIINVAGRLLILHRSEKV